MGPLSNQKDVNHGDNTGRMEGKFHHGAVWSQENFPCCCGNHRPADGIGHEEMDSWRWLEHGQHSVAQSGHDSLCTEEEGIRPKFWKSEGVKPGHDLYGSHFCYVLERNMCVTPWYRIRVPYDHQCRPYDVNMSFCMFSYWIQTHSIIPILYVEVFSHQRWNCLAVLSFWDLMSPNPAGQPVCQCCKVEEKNPVLFSHLRKQIQHVLISLVVKI